jgi:hypothetical protein
LFLQQLYELQQYELQQIDESEVDLPQNLSESDFEFESKPNGNYFKSMSDTEKLEKAADSVGPSGEGCIGSVSNGPTQKRTVRNEEDVLKLISQQNAKKRRLIKSLSNECLELFIESLGI